MSNRTVTKPCTLKVNLPLSFSSMSNRAVTKQYIETFGISRNDLMGYYDTAEMIERCQLKPNWEISGFVSVLDGGAILKFES